MGTSKILIDGVGIDLTQDTVAANKLLSGIKAHDSNGDSVTGSIQTWTGTQASGTKSITANGTHDVTQFASAAVNVPQGAVNCKRFEINLNADHPSYENLPLATDGVIAAHYADSTFYAVLVFHGGFQSKTSIQMVLQGNLSVNELYGSYVRSSSSATNFGGIAYNLNHTPSTSTINSMYANSDGVLGFTISSSYPLRAGDYTLLVFW